MTKPHMVDEVLLHALENGADPSMILQPSKLTAEERELLRAAWIRQFTGSDKTVNAAVDCAPRFTVASAPADGVPCELLWMPNTAEDATNTNCVPNRQP